MPVDVHSIPRLEFGNQQHIEAVRAYEDRLDESKVKPFRVTLNVTASGTITRTVQAHDIEEAEDLAHGLDVPGDGIDLSELEDIEIEVDRVKEVTEG